MRSKLLRIKVCNGVNWPESGRHNKTGLFENLAIVLTAFFILIGIAGCDGIPIPQISNSTVQEWSEDPFLSTVEFSTTTISMDATEAVLLPPIMTDTADPALCHIAVAGNPLDVTVPDGMLVDPGEIFTKIWRIHNSGTCIWTDQYTIVWFSGDQLGTSQEVPLMDAVNPGDTVEIAVEMKAPVQAGIYQSNWKICDIDGICFGLGPAGAYPFWAKIQVRQIATITPSPKPTQTPTSIIVGFGYETLGVDDILNVDNGETEEEANGDFQFILENEEYFLIPINQARITLFGQGIPTEEQCNSILYVTDSIILKNMDSSTTMCYKSTLGLPGYLRFLSFDQQSNEVQVEYTTWYAP
jgi:hypothetical protein